jgi:hypothetical protein
MSSMDMRAQSRPGIGLRSLAVIFSDDGLDFPPTAHPVRELLTFGMFLSGLIAFFAWGAAKLV